MNDTDESQELAPGIILKWLSGMCPVQAEGTVDGTPFYFRARHDTISLSIGSDVVMQPAWEWCELYGNVYSEEAGWISHELARSTIVRFAQKYQQGIPGNGTEYWAKHRIRRMRRMKQEHPEWFAALPDAMKAEIEAMTDTPDEGEA